MRNDDDDEWAQEEMPGVFAQIGPAAVPALAAYLMEGQHGKYASATAAEALRAIGGQHPEARAACAAALTRRLEDFENNDEGLNAFLISGLVELEAREALPLIERAFAGERVDEMVRGDWEDIQIELGLKTEREHPRKPNPLAALLPSLLHRPAVDSPLPVREDIRQWNEKVEAQKQAKALAQAQQIARQEENKRRKRKKK